jgi:hypothetical protein
MDIQENAAHVKWKSKVFRRKILRCFCIATPILLYLLLLWNAWQSLSQLRTGFVCFATGFAGFIYHILGFPTDNLPVFFTNVYNGFFVIVGAVVTSSFYLLGRKLLYIRTNKRISRAFHDNVKSPRIKSIRLDKYKVHGIVVKINGYGRSTEDIENNKPRLKTALRLASIQRIVSGKSDDIFIYAIPKKSELKNISEVLKRVKY